jgi:hypothetical protein
VDGIAAVDPETLAALLRITGPVPSGDGTLVGPDDAVAITLQGAYQSYANPSQRAARQAYLDQISSATLKKLTTEHLPTGPIVSALSQQAAGHHLLFWDAHPDVELLLAGHPIAGELPPATRGIGDVINNDGPNKLDYYLTRSVELVRACHAGRPNQLVLTLTNSAPSSPLPNEVSPPEAHVGQPQGFNRTLVNFYLPAGSQVLSLATDGSVQTNPWIGVERGLVTTQAVAEVEPGRASRIVVSFNAPPGSLADPAWLNQASVHPELTRSTSC